MKFTTI
ncbi:hypothetical protein D044_0741A, partial [Vibrio parahaemolyticus EKP-026]